MHEWKYGISSIFHNYPYILKVGDEKRDIDHMKSIMQQIIEQPLFINSDVFEQKLVHKDVKIYHNILKQKGIYSVLSATFIHMQRCLSENLGKRNGHLIKINNGIYSQEHLDNVGVEFDKNTQLLDYKILAKLIAKKIANPDDINDINIYEELLTQGHEGIEEPTFYKALK